MAGLLIFNPTPFGLSLSATATRASFKPPHKVLFPAVRFPGDPMCRKTRPRGLTVVTRASPSTSTYIFAFLLPFSLILITVFTSIRIADKLDEDFLEEFSINQAIRESNGEEEDDVDLSIQEEPARPRTRDRPKREI
ncbi:hypothetical protein FNV43_RR20136 [Rhamnella rubrinervis]|uniref:High chlorophyll fluorescence 153 n=1 Tax=Rhamnella rubrinervis TaxID=2594499 RepID=A0A8K0GUB2_9ROSA|nr:hypothetical protein FNV43_RR20136 [Rhamnella rubrinervis]